MGLLGSLARRGRVQKGQALMEYGLIMMLVSIVCILLLTHLGGQLVQLLQLVADHVTGHK